MVQKNILNGLQGNTVVQYYLETCLSIEYVLKTWVNIEYDQETCLSVSVLSMIWREYDWLWSVRVSPSRHWWSVQSRVQSAALTPLCPGLTNSDQ